MRLPDAYEEQAWVGTRWLVRKKTFAHVLNITSGRPQTHAIAAGTDGPVTVVTFRAADAELDALFKIGPPFFGARWGREVVGYIFGADVDWTEIAELLTDSYCVMAPKKLVDLVDRPPD